ncbi:gamma-glutamyl-gamma-aminobutyrate hydrolase family protein [Wolbachia endosymbiont of Pentidionis agamae]|uniref:gamma-glutamyl-gamma-aminobutyrate hydrolase family protein n=1 Tax=Wolbachia endosymbiont of Pentidionis agamae TaxID=3110435 RepID=UPI002FD09259
MHTFYKKIFNLLFVLLLFSSSFAYANMDNINIKNSNIVVGLLKTEKETYRHELGLSQNIYEMFNNFGVKTVLIDYKKLISLKKINAESLSLAKQDKILARKLTLDRIKIEVEKFIAKHNINRIVIPGNYYHVHTEPFAPTPCRQLVTEAIVQIVDDNPSIHLLGICGGLQGIMHAKGVEVVRVADIINDEVKQKSHLKSAPNPQLENVPLQQIRIVPNSRLAEIVSKFLTPDENGWFSVCFPDAHSGAVNNSPENRRKLELLGYKVVGFSNDGVIEAIEDKHGNVHFQSHPEALVVKSGRNFYLSTQKERQVSTLVAISIIHDFLYR